MGRTLHVGTAELTPAHIFNLGNTAYLIPPRHSLSPCLSPSASWYSYIPITRLLLPRSSRSPPPFQPSSATLFSESDGSRATTLHYTRTGTLKD